MVSEKAQMLTDEFNKTYWSAANSSDPDQYFQAVLLARQLVLELGLEGVLHDKLIDPEYTNKYTLEK